MLTGKALLSSALLVALGVALATTAIAAGFDSPESAVLALEQAYIQKNVDGAVAAMDFVEEGRQMLQKINPTLANDPGMIKQAADGRELAFRNGFQANGFPDFANLKCSFVRKTQIAPGLVELTQQCVSSETKSEHTTLVVKSDRGWRVTLKPPP